jgi:hypothetical protein
VNTIHDKSSKLLKIREPVADEAGFWWRRHIWLGIAVFISSQARWRNWTIHTEPAVVWNPVVGAPATIDWQSQFGEV